MNAFRPNLLLLVLAMVNAPSGAHAEEGSDRHPLLSKRYFASVGLFFPDRDLEFRLNGSVAGVNSTIDFAEQFKLDGDDETGSAEIGWRFGENWLLRGQYFDVDDSNTVTLTEDITWGDYTFNTGTSVGAGTSVTVTRAFVGRRIRHGDDYEFGIGFGLHILDLGASIRGDAFINGISAGFQDVSASVSGPLPNFGVWYSHAFSPEWAASVRFDWLSVDFDNFDGKIINAAAGLNYAITEHLGFGVSYNFFELNVGIDDSAWSGRAINRFDGAYIFLSGYW